MQNPRVAQKAYNKFAEPCLKAIMAYPEYDEVDWRLEGDGMYAPQGLTKSRLIDTFFFYQTNDPNEPNTVAFSEDEIANAEEVASRSKPSL